MRRREGVCVEGVVVNGVFSNVSFLKNKDSFVLIPPTSSHLQSTIIDPMYRT